MRARWPDTPELPRATSATRVATGLHVNPAALTGELAGRAGVDFRGGGDPERYREALEQLLRHLKAQETTSSVA